MENTRVLDVYLNTITAADLMTPNPVSISQERSVEEAVEFLHSRGIAAAPVIDEGGRPVGVVSRADILIHDHQAGKPRSHVFEYYDSEHTHRQPSAGTATLEQTQVRDIMTPAVFSVTPETPASRVIGDMTTLKVHRLFVVDETGVLIGVISALDVLRHLSSHSAQI